ncbi:DUF2279 domain-containing protein [Marivirga tractuosa]|uniref:DUF2279 domain-containing protein n=1 Tax=Marivirga tractuosa (strain ATCC 23168 / DSM 4126 / NBRC 15989 / NCIMB 1408 / VKM B-1430 / H-43) TaxID=643867 RepID=E4TLZ1_MARTH|nr:DUF2279 domain-containing protein [Marivirga tractuosa]ADR20282.1 hypothetical protein Ftrac_0273 [Marivirga tractuosa DSM 4126]BDD15276.1 DUF2279 domain-containing protein [Marivirga tractuosa]
MLNKNLYNTLICFILCSNIVLAQNVDTVKSVNKKRLGISAGLTAASYTAGILYLSEVWYKDHERVPMHFYDDNAGWKQMDKVAHAYISYHQSRAGYEMMKWSGFNENTSIFLGGSLGFIFQLPIEIFDGLYEGYGFSWGDVYANTAGTLLFISQQKLAGDQPVKLKFSYFPTSYSKINPRILGENALESLFTDYNAQTYWLSFNISSIIPSSNIPKWLNLAVGYSGGGMLSEFENPTWIKGERAPEINRYRQFFLSPDIDYTNFKSNKKFLNGILEALNLTKLPAPAIEFSTEHGWVFHFIHF